MRLENKVQQITEDTKLPKMFFMNPNKTMCIYKIGILKYSIVDNYLSLL